MIRGYREGTMWTTFGVRKGLGFLAGVLFLSTLAGPANATPTSPFPFPDYTSVDYTQIPIQETGVVDVVAELRARR